MLFPVFLFPIFGKNISGLCRVAVLNLF